MKRIIFIIISIYSLFSLYSVKGQSIKELREKAEENDIIAQYELGKLYLQEGDTNNAIYWCEKAAENELTTAQLTLAIIYYDKKEEEKVLKWLFRAGNNGNISAQNLLGHYFKEAKDFENSFYWFKKAAEQNDDDSQCYLGMSYYGGYGVEQDKEKAEFWLKKSAENGNLKAKQLVEDFYYSHLKFKGIEINGSVNDFVLQLQKQGFNYYTRVDNHTIMKGDFAGYKNSLLHIGENKEGNVKFVGVQFDYRDDWNLLFYDYENIKNMLITKYGKPAKCEEHFETFSQPTNNTDKMNAVRNTQCKYITTWVTIAGTIFVTISNIDYGPYVSLVYADDKNSDVDNQKAIDDL